MGAVNWRFDRHDRAVLGVFKASVGLDTEAEIRERTRCTPGEAFIVAVLRRGGSAELLSWWEEGLLYVQDVKRIVLSWPFDEPAQLEAAATARAACRARLRGGLRAAPPPPAGEPRK